MGVLFIACGPSGVGKTSLGRRLRQAHPQLTLSVSYTTRAARAGEVDGKDYHFVDEARFMRMRDNGEFAEWAKVHGNFYATPRSEITQAFARKEDVFFDVDYQGALQLQAAFPTESVSVLIAPPSLELLERRLRGRATDDEATIARRLDAALHELEQHGTCDYILINDDFEQAYQEFEHIYLAARKRGYLWVKAIEALLDQG